MNNIKKSIAIVTLALFSATSASLIAPACALAAPHHPYPIHHPHDRNKHLGKGDKAVLLIGGTVGIVSAIIGSIKHHRRYKSYN